MVAAGWAGSLPACPLAGGLQRGPIPTHAEPSAWRSFPFANGAVTGPSAARPGLQVGPRRELLKAAPRGLGRMESRVQAAVGGKRPPAGRAPLAAAQGLVMRLAQPSPAGPALPTPRARARLFTAAPGWGGTPRSGHVRAAPVPEPVDRPGRSLVPGRLRPAGRLAGGRAGAELGRRCSARRPRAARQVPPGAAPGGPAPASARGAFPRPAFGIGGGQREPGPGGGRAALTSGRARCRETPGRAGPAYRPRRARLAGPPGPLERQLRRAGGPTVGARGAAGGEASLRPSGWPEPCPPRCCPPSTTWTSCGAG